MTYLEISDKLIKKNFVPSGRYEHHRRGDANPLLFPWYNIDTHQALIVVCRTDDLGMPTDVIQLYEEVSLDSPRFHVITGVEKQ